MKEIDKSLNEFCVEVSVFWGFFRSHSKWLVRITRKLKVEKRNMTRRLLKSDPFWMIFLFAAKKNYKHNGRLKCHGVLFESRNTYQFGWKVFCKQDLQWKNSSFLKGPFTLYDLRLRFDFASNGLTRVWWCCCNHTLWTLPLNSVQPTTCTKKNYSRNRTVWTGL